MPVILPRIQQSKHRRDNLFKRHRTVSPERRNTQIHNRRHRRHLHIAIAWNTVLHIPINRLLRTRCPPLSAQCLDLRSLSIKNKKRNLSTNRTRTVIRDIKRKNSRSGCIGRIAPPVQNLNTRCHSTCTSRRNNTRLTLSLPSNLSHIYAGHNSLLF